ncbi:MAG: hypothetical protein C5B56_13635 [Proteobacteria bacterium]|nr:MAG: hypothetical protein C5B56_13635 [Pseudomonadota bacterium]
MSASGAKLAQFRRLYSKLSWLELTAAVLAAVGLLLTLLNLSGGYFTFLKFLAILAATFLIVRVIAWSRKYLLWSLRNRLIVAYLFIAVVPILLIVILVSLAARIVYSQLGAYLLYEDIQTRKELLADLSQHILVTHVALPPGVTGEESEKVLAAQFRAAHDRDLPGLTIAFSNDTSLLGRVTGSAMNAFTGLLQEEGKPPLLWLISIRAVRDSKSGFRVVTLRVPVTPDFLAGVAPDLGAIQLSLMDRYTGTAGGVIYSSAGSQYVTSTPIVARNRSLQPASFWIDTPIEVVSRLDAVHVGADGKVDKLWPVLTAFNARPSQLNARIFSSLGELRDYYLLLFLVLGALFLLIEIAALATGIVLTTRITKTVSDLYQATQFVQAEDFSHRVPVEKQDQLGKLGDSFNRMTQRIGDLLVEKQQRERLQSELSIAREVQNQLFPQAVPPVPGVEIEAVCKAARMVSGDYYDFIQVGPTQIAMAIADISGKGISAALLMASLQAALRSQLLAPGSEKLSTAELVSRLNRHMVRNTADDRFATFFVAVYDSETRRLRYTNAGHLPSFFVCNGQSHHLDKGGMVLGVVEDYVYEEGSLVVPDSALVVGYSDGLVEPENVYGEQFGIQRLQETANRLQRSTPKIVAESLMMAAEEWAGTPEQADDMTVIVARLR